MLSLTACLHPGSGRRKVSYRSPPKAPASRTPHDRGQAPRVQRVPVLRLHLLALPLLAPDVPSAARMMVALMPGAERDIGHEALRSMSGREVGGWLFGRCLAHAGPRVLEHKAADSDRRAIRSRARDGVDVLEALEGGPPLALVAHGDGERLRGLEIADAPVGGAVLFGECVAV